MEQNFFLWEKTLKQEKSGLGDTVFFLEPEKSSCLGWLFICSFIHPLIWLRLNRTFQRLCKQME